MDKKLLLQLNGNRKVTGILRGNKETLSLSLGYDPFMNIVLDEAIEQVSASVKNHLGSVVIRGNSILVVEGLERIA